jgi:hypothetical protein
MGLPLPSANADTDLDLDALSDAELAQLKKRAMMMIAHTFAEGQDDGLDGDLMAQAALFAAFSELVSTYGEDAVATYAQTFAPKILAGAFSLVPRH